MFTGAVPYGTSYKTVNNVSPNHEYIDELVAYLIRQSPDDRPPTVDEIKNELIKRNQEYISRQKISELQNTVIPSSDIDDPLVSDPIRLISFDWHDRILKLILSQSTNNQWVLAMNNIGSHTALWGKGPEAFKFRGNEAIIQADEREVQGIIDHFKDWLPKANAIYERTLLKQIEDEERQRHDQLKIELAKEEACQRLLRDIEI